MGRGGRLTTWLILASMLVVIGRCQQQEEKEKKPDGEKSTNHHDEDNAVSEPAAAVVEELGRVDCEEPSDCVKAEGSYCDLDSQVCVCKPDYPVTDTKNCYKESKYDEFCRLDIQCQRLDKNSRCNHDLNVCQCLPRYEPQSFSKGKEVWCVASTSGTNMTPGSYFDPALFGIMGGLVLMFIVLCVVLQLFAKAQFRDNRTIFNTPNPRLMNVSLMKDNAKDRKVSNCEEGLSSREPRRKGSPAVLAGGGGTSASGGGGIEALSEDTALVEVEIRDT